MGWDGIGMGSLFARHGTARHVACDGNNSSNQDQDRDRDRDRGSVELNQSLYPSVACWLNINVDPFRFGFVSYE